MSIFRPATSRQISLGLTILRVVTGITFLAHGYQKLFVFGVTGIQGGFAQMGVPMPTIMGPLIGMLEFFGGIALVIGFLTRPLAVLFALDMLGAIFVVHGKNGFFLPQGFEFVLILCAASVALALAGGGAYSADEAIARRSGRAVP